MEHRRVFEVTCDRDCRATEDIAATCSGAGASKQRQQQHSDTRCFFTGLVTGELDQYTRVPTGQQQMGPDEWDADHGAVALTLSRTQKVSKKPIDKLVTVSSGEFEVVMALSAGQLFLIDTQDLDVQPMKHGSLKGATSITQDLCNVGCRTVLAICRSSIAPGLPKKLRLVFLEVNCVAGKAEAQVLYEQSLDDVANVRDIVWYGDVVLLRSESQYLHVTLSTQDVKEIYSTQGEEVKTCMAPMVEDKSVVLLMEDIGAVVDMVSGEPTGTVMQFPVSPMSIIASFPYVLGVFSKSVYVYDVRKEARDSHVQTISLSNFMHPDQDLVSVLVEGPGVDEVSVLACHGTTMVLLARVALEDQCRHMVRAGQFDEALRIAEVSTSESNAAYLSDNVCAEAGFLLLGLCDFAGSVRFFRKCRQFQPFELFALFPSYTKRWRGQAAAKRYWSLHPPLSPLDDLIAQVQASRSDNSQQANISSDSRRDDLLKEALEIFLDLLVEWRSRDGLLLPDGVDTLVVHLLLDLGSTQALEDLVNSNAPAPNQVVIEEVEARLSESGRIHALALLRESRSQFTEAVELWVSLAEGDRAEASLVVSDTLKGKEDCKGGHIAKAERQGKPLLETVVVDVVRVLRKSGAGSAAMKQYLPWLMHKSAEATLGLLADIPMPVEYVMQLAQTTGPELRWRYLDYVVNTRASLNPDYHNDYALALIERLKAQSDTSQNPGGTATPQGGDDEDDGGDGEALPPLRAALRAFLDRSEFFNLQGVLSALKGTSLSREQVLVHQKLGNHKEALRLLTYVLNDRDGAVSYCEQLGTQEGYLTLLDMFLQPQPQGGPPLYTAAVRLLGSKGASLSPQRVLDALSSEMPLPLAYETLARMLRERMHRKRAGQASKGLAKAHQLAVAQRRVTALTEHVDMTDDRACRKCHARIGLKVFGVYPNGVLVCYRCMMKSGKDAQYVCPVTGRDFSKESNE